MNMIQKAIEWIRRRRLLVHGYARARAEIVVPEGPYLVGDDPHPHMQRYLGSIADEARRQKDREMVLAALGGRAAL